MLLTFEPGDTAVGRELRRIVLDPATGALADRTEALLYAADKAEHVDTVVQPALDRGEVVVTDRYVDSTLAYQGAGRALDVAEVERVARWATRDLRPHLTVVLDLAPEQGLGRFEGRDRIEGESLEFHERVREAFLAMAAADPDHYLVARRPAPASRRSPPPCASGSPRCSGRPRARCTRDAPSGTAWSASAAAVEALRTRRRRPRDEPRLAVHRAARARALQRRDRLRRRAAVRARREGRAGCGECHACHTVLAGSHADVSVIRTEKLSIGVDEVRDLVRRAALAPVGRRWQVMIVEDADRLTDAGLQRAAQGDRGAHRPHGLDALRADRRGRAADDPLPLPAGHADHADRRGRRRLPGPHRRACPTALASYAARASQGHIGRARALARDEGTRNRRREVVSLPGPAHLPGRAA